MPEINSIPFVEVDPISGLPLRTSLEPGGHMLYQAADGKTYRISTDSFYQLLHKVAIPVLPNATGPFIAETWLKPQVSSASPGTSYPNLTPAKDENGNSTILKALEGFDTLFFYNGNYWVKVANRLPRDEDARKAMRSFVEPLDTTVWEPMDFPGGESDNKYINVNFGETPSPYAKYGVIQASSLGNITKLKLRGSLSIFGNSIAWWIGQRPDGSRVVLKSGVISSGVAEIDVDPQFSSYIYSRSKPDSTLEKQPRVLLPVQEDAIKKYIDLIGSGYSGVLDLASLGLKESNTAEQNTAIINAAIESQAGKSDAKHIKFPGGSFAVNEISMKAGTAMSGAGRIHTRLYTPAGSTARFIINIQDGQRARGQLSDIFIDARNTTEGGIYLNNVYNFNLFDMVLYGAKQYCIWLKGALMHSLRDIYILGADIGLKTSHLPAFATNLCSYDKVFFVQQNKKCVELNAGSDYRFTSCCFEDSGISGDETTGGVHAIGLSPYGEGVDVTFSNCWSEGIRGGFIYRFDNCKGNSVIEHCMLYNGGNGAGTIANAVVNFNSNVELSGATRFSTLTADSKPFPKNIRAVGGSTLISNPNINVGTNNVGTLQKAKFESIEFVI